MTTYASDSFVRPNGAIGTSDGPGSLVWGVPSGGLQIFSNAAFGNGSNGATSIGTLDTSQTNVSISADIHTTGTTNRIVIGLVARYIDTSNYLAIYMAKNPAIYGAGTNYVLIEQHLAGVVTYPAALNGAGIAESTTYAFKAVISGSTAAVWKDGVEVISATSFNAGLTGTKHGLWTVKDIGGVYDDGNSYWQSFLVTDVPLPSGRAPIAQMTGRIARERMLR